MCNSVLHIGPVSPIKPACCLRSSEVFYLFHDWYQQNHKVLLNIPLSLWKSYLTVSFLYLVTKVTSSALEKLVRESRIYIWYLCPCWKKDFPPDLNAFFHTLLKPPFLCGLHVLNQGSFSLQTKVHCWLWSWGYIYCSLPCYCLKAANVWCVLNCESNHWAINETLAHFDI